MKKQILHKSILFFASIFLIACGSNSKYDAGELSPGTTALSIVYDSTTEAGGKMIGHYHVHAVDDQGKPMAGLKLKLALINGVRELRKQKLQRGIGNILSTTPITFNDNGVNFSQAGINIGDSLIILPTAGKASVTYLGDWRISDIGPNLTLEEASYHLESTENVTYIIGNEERLLGGKNGDRGILSVAHIQKLDTNGTSVTDQNGFTYFDVVFDPVLAGHTVTIGVHTDAVNRLGIAKVISLRGAKFSAATVTIENIGGKVPVSMYMTIDPGNGGTEYLRDVNLVPSSFTVEPIDSCSINYNESDFHTDGAGRVHLVIDTKGKTTVREGNETKETGSDTCEIKWEGAASSIYLEY